jgi:predicted lysophospholipase L1 biosynthesis ABC-type transport system permease subunit
LLLRVLGASRALLRRIAVAEAVALAALAALVGGLAALVAAAGLVWWVFDLPFDPPLVDLAGLALAAFGITAFVGGATAVTAPTRSPIEGLRGEAG